MKKPILKYEGREFFSEAELKQRVAELDLENSGAVMPKAAREEWNKLNETIAEFEARRDRILELARSPRSRESGDGADFRHDWNRVESPELSPRVRENRDAGLRAIQRHEGILEPKAADRLDKHVRSNDPGGLDARYLDAVGSAAYSSAFAKMLADPNHGHLRFSPQEVAAVQEVSAVESERTMNITTGSAGAFAVPFALDPTIILTGSGVLNPLRDVCRVETISAASIWKGVSSDGVVAAFAAESAPATDASPVLVQPTITPQKAFCFVPFSIELGNDYVGLQEELYRLIADAKNVLEATKFLLGTGTNEPGGILNIGSTGGLTTTQRVLTAGVATYAVGDPWLLKAAIPARFIPTTSYVAAPAIWDKTYRFVAQGSTTEPRQFSDGDRGGDFLGAPKDELSTVVTTTTTGSRIMVGGDFKTGVRIVDRIGLQVELIPQLFGASQGNLPVGQRGLYSWWRVGSGVVAQNALRYLEVQ
jgi:HK97 family phage major capsid protein